jgi:hypothetical protein
MNTPEIDVSLVLNELKTVIANQAQEIAILKATIITMQRLTQSESVE